MVRVRTYAKAEAFLECKLDEVMAETIEEALQKAEALVDMHKWMDDAAISAITITTDGEEYDPKEDEENGQ